MEKLKRDLPPLNWLRTFEAAARLLNFSAAGRELNMTQSAVSQQIRLLEHHLGEPLFVRVNRRVQLTRSGQAWLPVVQGAISGLKRSTAEIFSPVGRGHLVLEVNIAFAMLWLTPRLPRFAARYPGLTLKLVHANWESEFDIEGADLAIMHGQGNWPARTALPLLHPVLHPCCSVRLRRLVNDPVDLCSQPLLEVIGNRQTWRDWFQRAAVDADTDSVSHRVDSLAMAFQMAEYGHGVFLCYRDLLQPGGIRHHLEQPFDIGLPTEDNYYLTWPENRVLPRSAQLFIDWVQEELEQAGAC